MRKENVAVCFATLAATLTVVHMLKRHPLQEGIYNNTNILVIKMTTIR